MKYGYRMDKDATGKFKKAAAQQEIGNIRCTHDVILFQNAGDFIQFSCPEGVSENSALEILELHQKADESFCYHVYVNDQLCHVQSMEPLSDSLYPCFVKLALSPGDEIRIVNTTNEPVRFVSVYLYPDIAVVVEENLTPMEIGLCFPRPSYADYEKDLSIFKRIQADFACLSHFTVAAGIEIPYMLLNDDELRFRFRYVLSLSKDACIPLIFNFNTWWDATPTGRDGKGGYFSDAEYQQVVYDPETGKTRLSIPNLWRNTPWLSMNNETLNAARKARLDYALFILTQINAEYGFISNYRIFIDNEPTYWAEFAYSQSPEAGGDFSMAAAKAARADGVDLTPKGKVTHAQKEWLYKNHSSYISDLAKQFYTSNAKEIAVLNENGLTYTNNYVSENTFTHIFPNTGYPYATGKHLMYEQHVTKWARLGLECAGFQDERVLSYASASGRFAQVNAERCCYADPMFHLQFYAHGAVSDIIFNYFYDTDVEHIRWLDTLIDQPAPDLSYGKTVSEFDACRDSLEAPCVYSHENLAVSPLRERWTLRPDRLGKGSITIRIGDSSDYPLGGYIEITGLIRPENGAISLHMGHTSECMEVSMALPQRNSDYQHIPLRVPLGDIVNAAGPIYLRLDIESDYYDDWAEMNSVWRIRAVQTLNAQSGAFNRFTLRQLRALNMQLATRMDAIRALETNFKTIGSLEAFGQTPKEAYESIMRNISASQTRMFKITACGKIAAFKAEVVDCFASPILIFPSDNPENAYIIGEAGAYVVLKSGKRQWKLTPFEQRAFDEFEGTFIGYNEEKRTLRVQTHRLNQYAWQPYLDFDCAEDAEISICAHEITGDLLRHISSNPYTPSAIANAKIDAHPTLTSLKAGDAVRLSIKNKIVVSVSAIRGLARGRLIAFDKMTLLPEARNAYLTLETAPGVTAVFELGAGTHLNYVKAPAENAMLAGADDLNLDVGSTLLISFEGERYENRPYRAIEITVV